MASQITFTTLPRELLGAIATQLLFSRDVKNFRLTCKYLAEAVLASLKLTRVFLSAHPVNIEALRAIADHEYFAIRSPSLYGMILDSPRVKTTQTAMEMI